MTWESRRLALTLLLATCTFDYDETGELCIYTSRSVDQIQSELPRFVDDHPGIRLRCPEHEQDSASNLVCASGLKSCKGASWSVFRQSTGELTDTLEAEFTDGALSADVLWGVGVTHVIFLATKYADLIRDYSPEFLEEVYASIKNKLQEDAPSEAESFWSWFMDPTYASPFPKRKQPRWLGIDAFTVSLCINKDKLAELNNADCPGKPSEPLDPDHLDWDSLMDCRLTGHIAAPMATASGTGFAQLVGAIKNANAADFLVCDMDTDPQGLACARWQRLDALDSQIAIYTKSGDLPCQLAAVREQSAGHGENIGIAIGITHDGADLLKSPPDKDKYPNEIYDWAPTMHRVVPTDPGFDVAVNVLIEQPERPPAALTFLDWASSADAMNEYTHSASLVAHNTNGKTPSSDLAGVVKYATNLQGAGEVLRDLKNGWLENYCQTEPDMDEPSMLPANVMRALATIQSHDGKFTPQPHRCSKYLNTASR